MLNHAFKQKLSESVYQAIKLLAENQEDTAYHCLMDACSEWTDKHFRFAELLTSISLTTLRRLFQPHNYPHKNFNSRTHELFCMLLGYDTWKDLVESIENQIILDKVKELKNFS